METKKCGGCGQVKPVSDYYKDAYKKPVYRCKPCHIEKSKARYKMISDLAMKQKWKDLINNQNTVQA